VGAHGGGIHSSPRHVRRKRVGALAGVAHGAAGGRAVSALGVTRRRRVVDRVMVGTTYAAAAVATLPLIMILVYLAKQGASAVSWVFFTNMPKPVGEAGGGMANAIVGTLILIGVASAIGLPVGVGAGLYLAERR